MKERIQQHKVLAGLVVVTTLALVVCFWVLRDDLRVTQNGVVLMIVGLVGVFTGWFPLKSVQPPYPKLCGIAFLISGILIIFGDVLEYYQDLLGIPQAFFYSCGDILILVNVAFIFLLLILKCLGWKGFEMDKES
ncbi:MAG: hypothetical protein ACM3UZ_11800 [Acidobacteriota bacterium]